MLAVTRLARRSNAIARRPMDEEAVRTRKDWERARTRIGPIFGKMSCCALSPSSTSASFSARSWGKQWFYADATARELEPPMIPAGVMAADCGYGGCIAFRSYRGGCNAAMAPNEILNHQKSMKSVLVANGEVVVVELTNISEMRLSGANRTL